MSKSLYTIIISILILCSCGQEQGSQTDDFQVKIRLSNDPGRINPIFAGSSSAAREVYPYIFLQLGEYNPLNLKLEPILAKTMPEVRAIEEGPWEGGIRMDFEILDEAEWSDGKPITAEDYLFTLKAVNLPLVDAGRWRAGLNDIVEIQIDPSNNKAFSVIFKEEYLLAVEVAMSFEILPAHIYDAEGDLTELTLAEIKNEQLIQEKIGLDSSLQSFSQKFNSLEFNIENCSGSGPYELIDWESNQYILLRRKSSYWGAAFPDRPFLNAVPNELVFQIIADEASSITQLKAGGIDIMTILNGENFDNLIKNESSAEQFSFHTPQLAQYYYLGLNNRHIALRDKAVRKALAHLIDIDNIIEKLESGRARRIIGTVPRFSEAYHEGLEPIPYDLEKARSLLKDSGWADRDGDGIVEKMIDEKLVELHLRIFVTQSELGKRISLLLKQNASQAGIDIEIIQKDFRSYYREHILKGDYEIAALSIRQALSDYDPYARWHSDNSSIGGANLTGYSNPVADELIINIQNTVEADKNIRLYRELQEVMYEDQPVIFLYSPVSRIVVNKRLNPAISVKRPGYFANLFEFVGEGVTSQ